MIKHPKYEKQHFHDVSISFRQSIQRIASNTAKPSWTSHRERERERERAWDAEEKGKSTEGKRGRRYVANFEWEGRGTVEKVEETEGRFVDPSTQKVIQV